MSSPRTALPGRGAGLSLVETTDRLWAEFAGALDLATISRVVCRARQDLAGAPEPALPELVERLARVDLVELTRRF